MPVDKKKEPQQDKYKVTIEFNGDELTLTTEDSDGDTAVQKKLTTIEITAGPRGVKYSVTKIPWLNEEEKRLVKELENEESEKLADKGPTPGYF